MDNIQKAVGALSSAVASAINAELSKFKTDVNDAFNFCEDVSDSE